MRTEKFLKTIGLLIEAWCDSKVSIWKGIHFQGNGHSHCLASFYLFEPMAV